MMWQNASILVTATPFSSPMFAVRTHVLVPNRTYGRFPPPVKVSLSVFASRTVGRVEDNAPATASPEFIQSLARGLDVIRCFDAEHQQMTLSEVARRTGLTRATARRFLITLVSLGYARSDGREFALRPRVLELGYSYLSSLTLPDIAQPHLEALATTVSESCSVAVLDGDDVVYVARVTMKRIMTLTINVGTRFPAYATSMGRVLLASQDPEWLDAYMSRTELEPFTDRTLTEPARFRSMLRRVHSQGYALTDRELENGIRSLACPIRDEEDRVVAAMNISMHASRASVEALRKEFLPFLRTAAESLEADLAGR